MDDEKDTYVYVITNGPECKIGIAADVQQRLDALQCANPLRLWLAYLSRPMAREKAQAAEMAAHAALDAFATDGGAEWFRVEPEKAAVAVETSARVAMRHAGSVGKRGRKPSLSAEDASAIAIAVTGRDAGTSVAEIAATFGVSVRTAYRAVASAPSFPASLPAEPRPSASRRRLLKEAERTHEGPMAEVALDGERYAVTKRAADALHAAHAKLADGWRVLNDDRAAMDDFLRQVRFRVAKAGGIRVPATFTLPRGPWRYSLAVTFGAQPKATPPTATAVPAELPPWPLPWEPPHPTEAVGQLFRRAMRGQPLPAAAAALGLIDKAMATLTEFRALLAETAPAATGPPAPVPEEPTPEPPKVAAPEPPKTPAEKSAIFAKMFPDLVKDQPPPGFGTPIEAP